MIRANRQRFWILAAFATTISVPASAQWTVTNLNPAGATESAAYGVGGSQQAGYAVVGGQRRASLWNGTAASWVDLNPAGSTQSYAYGVSGGQKVGVADYRASLWSGTATSRVDLSPAGASGSAAYGVSGGQQVGYAEVGGIVRASLWSGTAASWVDLQTFLPPEFTSSSARGIWQDAGMIYVVGQGFNSATGRYEALMWVSQINAQTITASSTSLAPGIVISGTPADMFTSNDVYYVLRPGIVLSSSQSPIVLALSGTAPASTASALSMVVESHASQANIRETIDVYNFVTSSYETICQSVLTTSDVSNNLSITNRSAHIGANNELRTRLSYKSIGPILSYPWRVSIDEATWRYAN